MYVTLPLSDHQPISRCSDWRLSIISSDLGAHYLSIRTHHKLAKCLFDPTIAPFQLFYLLLRLDQSPHSPLLLLYSNVLSLFMENPADRDKTPAKTIDIGLTPPGYPPTWTSLLAVTWTCGSKVGSPIEAYLMPSPEGLHSLAS
jgi:hypothetical protein